MKKFLTKTFFSLIVLAAAMTIGYFANVEIQSYFGRQALAKAALVNRPLDEALQKAKAENKLVLVDVAAIWCPTCRRLDNDVFADAQVKQKINERFVFSRIEYESDEGQKFLAAHNAEGFPNLWILDGEGKTVKRLKVTFDPAEFLAQLP